MTAAEKLITENIDVWSSAIKQKASTGRGSSSKQELYGIKKLRELILELAVRGLLVPQISTEKSASVLLEDIEVEKTQLIKTKKIKKQKKLPEIEPDGFGFDLPPGWVCTRLGNIGNIFNGNSVNARTKAERYTNIEGLSYIGTKDVGYGFEPLVYENDVRIPVGEPKFKVARKGAVLICSEGGSAGKKCGITQEDICFGNKLYANELYGGIESNFILSAYLTPTFFQNFSASMTGIIGGISTAKFIELPIVLPPLQEQKRIVDKVDELMALCDQLEQEQENSINAHQTLVETLLGALTNASEKGEFDFAWVRIAEHFDTLFTTEHSIDQLKKTILQLAVMGKLVPQDPSDEPASGLLEKIVVEKEQLIEEKKIKNQKPPQPIKNYPFSVPESWEWTRVNTVINPEREISYGIIKLEKEPSSGGVPTLRCSDVRPRHLDLSGVRTVASEIEEPYKRTRLRGGEVLVNIRGTLGGVALVPEELEGYNIAREVAMLDFNPCVFGLYAVNLIASPFFWEMIESNLKGIAYKGLNLSVLRELPIPLPPIEEQIRIVEKVDELLLICDQLKTQINIVQSTQLYLADAMAEQALS